MTPGPGIEPGTHWWEASAPICDIETNEKLITLATIYAPNEDDPGFLKDFTIT